MGLDVVIYAKAKAPELNLSLPDGFELMSYDGPTEGGSFHQSERTHSVSTLARYYSLGYERGPWPDICAVLMQLHACHDVELVWYGNDCEDEVRLCPPERVLEISAHYMKNEHRPYRNSFS